MAEATVTVRTAAKGSGKEQRCNQDSIAISENKNGPKTKKILKLVQAVC